MGRDNFCLLEAQPRPGDEVREMDFRCCLSYDQREIAPGSLDISFCYYPGVRSKAQVHLRVNGTADGEELSQ